ncbi:MAG: hypothetical protein RI955_679, partial [Bacteroidota bacterium]
MIVIKKITPTLINKLLNLTIISTFGFSGILFFTLGYEANEGFFANLWIFIKIIFFLCVIFSCIAYAIFKNIAPEENNFEDKSDHDKNKIIVDGGFLLEIANKISKDDGLKLIEEKISFNLYKSIYKDLLGVYLENSVDDVDIMAKQFAVKREEQHNKISDFTLALEKKILNDLLFQLNDTINKKILKSKIIPNFSEYNFEEFLADFKISYKPKLNENNYYCHYNF